MSLWGQMKQTMGHAWDGNAAAVGDTAGILMSVAGQVPEIGGLLPDFEETSGAVNDFLGIDSKEEVDGNLGNHIGTVLGGAAGFLGGPGGMAVGAGIGSAAGGWLAEMLGDDSNKTTLQRERRVPHVDLVPE